MLRAPAGGLVFLLCIRISASIAAQEAATEPAFSTGVAGTANSIGAGEFLSGKH